MGDVDASHEDREVSSALSGGGYKLAEFYPGR